jgi:phosphopantetheine adenylyltransferase/dephospho-CoA kinase
MTFAIGLTGGIASGKSLVSSLLAERGAVVIDADRLGHEAYRAGTDCFDRVVAEFGRDVVGTDGEIDRKALGGKVFGDAEARKRLEGIVWPALRELARQRIEEERSKGADVVVLEAAVLIEAGWQDLVDEVWVAEAERETAIRRLAGRNGLSREQAEARLDAQLTNEERRRGAAVVIENNGTVEELRARVDASWSDLRERLKARV